MQIKVTVMCCLLTIVLLISSYLYTFTSKYHTNYALLHTIKDFCGKSSSLSPSGLQSVILDLISTMNRSKEQLCIMEVGTAEGKGTTVALYQALRRNCLNNGQDFTIYSYETSKLLAQEAAYTWNSYSKVVIFNEIVLEEEFLNLFVINNIVGPEQSTYPGKQYYQDFYSSLFTNKETVKTGGRLSSFPTCKLDMVLIDSTRFAHAGIIKTILSSLRDATDALFLIENDFWSYPQLNHTVKENELDIIRQHWNLLTVKHFLSLQGEQWPWVSFKIQL